MSISLIDDVHNVSWFVVKLNIEKRKKFALIGIYKILKLIYAIYTNYKDIQGNIL